jgi:glycosyltransferase involved in cell wall biosynthesis
MMDLHKTGVGYYTEHLISNLAKYHGADMQLTGYYFDFLSHNHKQPPALPWTKFKKISLVPGKLLSVCRRLHFQPPLEAFTAARSDALLFTNYVSLPTFSKRPAALCIYDLSFLDHPQYLQSVNLAYLQRFCPPSIKRADLIITISEFTKKRLQHHYPGLAAKIIVTPIPPAPIDSQAAHPIDSELLAKGVQPGKYLLYLGTIEPRKNIQNLVRAYALLPDGIRKEYSLVLAGGKGWKDEEILQEIQRQTSAGAHIIQTGYISNEQKHALYKHAASFVLPSHYEGFGMPILEAMQHNTPVVVSDIPIFHEVAGDAAEFFDKDDPQDIANHIVHVLRDPALQNTLKKRAVRQLAAFSWKENAAEVYGELLDLAARKA